MRNKSALAVAAGVISLSMSGCDVAKPAGAGSDPLTPQESRAQVLDAARDIATTLNLVVAEAFFWHSSCNDQGDAPFRGRLVMRYPKAASAQESRDQVTRMVERLRTAGWSGDPDFATHGSALSKDNVIAVFGPQAADLPLQSIEVLGECRDLTTTNQTRGSGERVSLG